jgi:hypothetical protein
MGVPIQIRGANGPNRFPEIAKCIAHSAKKRIGKQDNLIILLFLYVEYKELFNGVDACIEARCWM